MRSYRFHAHLAPTTPLRVLDMHYATRELPIEVSGGRWEEIRPAYEFLDDGSSIATVGGQVPPDGGDLLIYLKQLRRIVEEERDTSVPRIDDALARTRRIRAIDPLRTYSRDSSFSLTPNATLDDYTKRIFHKPRSLLNFVLETVYGIGFKDLDKSEKAVANAADNTPVANELGRTLSAQCESLGWQLTRLKTCRTAHGLWCGPGGIEGNPERVALAMLLLPGERGSFCEGASIKLLMKAAAFEFLAQHHLFDRASAARTYFESQCTTLVDRRASIVAAIGSSDPATVACSLSEILAASPPENDKPTLEYGFLIDLYVQLGAESLAAIADVFVRNPGAYRAGWPDLVLTGPEGLRFVEVKTTDLFHPTQLKFAHDIAKPLGLRCEVVQLIQAGSHDP